MEGQVANVEQEVIITNNNLLLHFSGHNNDLLLLFFRTLRSSGNILYLNKPTLCMAQSQLRRG